MARSKCKLWRRASATIALTLALLLAFPRPGHTIALAVPQEQGCGPGSETLIVPLFLSLFIVMVLVKGREEPVTRTATPQTLRAEIAAACKEARGSSSGLRTSTLQTIAAASSLSDGTAGDFDRDGHPDFAVADEGANQVSVRLGNPDGTVGPARTYATGAGPVRIIAGQFNADSNLDLVTANFGNGVAGDLSLLRGRANGRFKPAISITAGAVPLDVAAGDVNGDGHLDLVAATASTNPAILRLGNGDGTFQAETALGVTGVQSVVVAKLGDDDDADVVTNRGVLLGHGNGTFEMLAALPGGIAPSVVRVGDVDGDDRLDVVALSSGLNFLSVMLGNADGTLQAPRHYVTGDDPSEVAIADLDGDDAVDLLVSNASDEHLSLMRGNGDGTFDAAPTHPTVAGLGIGSTAAAVADFTGDDVPDVVVANGGTSALLAGLGGGALAPFASLAGLGGSRVVAGDWNGNGASDLAFTSPGVLAIALGNDNGSFGAPTNLALPSADSFADFVAQALLDAGTVPDLLVANTGAGNVSVFLGNGSGGFTEKPTVPIGTFPNGIATGDLDDDQTTDLVVTNLGGFGALNGGVRLALGNGDGTFAMPQVLRSSGAPESVVVADFDGDDLPDVAYVVEDPLFDWDVEVLLGEGDGQLSDPMPLGLPYDLVRGLRTADFDGDGNPDLAISFAGTRAAILFGKGNGRFHPPFEFDAGGGWTLPADLDQDALPDLVVSTEVGVTAAIRNVLDEQGAEFAPDTTITDGQALYETTAPPLRFNIRFTTDEPGSGFECRVKQLKPVANPGAWEACTSPYRERLVPGKYQFLVRAVDIAGNKGPKPAKQPFRVVAE